MAQDGIVLWALPAELQGRVAAQEETTSPAPSPSVIQECIHQPERAIEARKQ